MEATKNPHEGGHKSLTARHSTTALSTGPVSPAPVEASLAVTAALPTYTEPPELEPKERLCCQCQHFSQSSYGYPLGLCVGHGNRIQHSTSEPTHFGCGTFEPKEGWS